MTSGAMSRQQAPPPVRPRIGVSSCLLGEQVRFNGGHSRSRFLTDELGPHAVSRVMVIISFTDSAGNHWARGARGELRQLPSAAIDYWKVHMEDVDWLIPTRLD
jgi:hypothetical protein